MPSSLNKKYIRIYEDCLVEAERTGKDIKKVLSERKFSDDQITKIIDAKQHGYTPQVRINQLNDQEFVCQCCGEQCDLAEFSIDLERYGLQVCIYCEDQVREKISCRYGNGRYTPKEMYVDLVRYDGNVSDYCKEKASERRDLISQDDHHHDDFDFWGINFGINDIH